MNQTTTISRAELRMLRNCTPSATHVYLAHKLMALPGSEYSRATMKSVQTLARVGASALKRAEQSLVEEGLLERSQAWEYRAHEGEASRRAFRFVGLYGPQKDQNGERK